MNYKLWYDKEAGAAFVKILNRLTEDDARNVMSQANEMLADKEHSYLVCDCSKGTRNMVDRGARKAFMKDADPAVYDKIAMFGADSSVRMLAKVILTLTGVSKKARFFKTEREAIGWLTKDVGQ